MAALNEINQFDVEVFRIETDTVWKGGEEGPANKQGKALSNRTQWLKAEVEALGDSKQPLDATLTALAALATIADRMIYSTGPDTFALTPLSAFIRTLLDDADAATARATLGAISQAQLDAAIAALVASSPAALDTLNELAAALGNDANFATTVTNVLTTKAPLASPVFTGDPKAPTPGQFDNDASLATTEFVRRAVGNYRSLTAYNASAILTNSAIGGLVSYFGNTAGQTLTLPNAEIPEGSAIAFFNQSSQNLNIDSQGANTINTADPSGTASTTSITLFPGDNCIVVSNGASIWNEVGQRTKAFFGSSLAASGYQKLPSGLIIQWGGSVSIQAGSTITVNFPIAFPVSCSIVLATKRIDEDGYANTKVISPSQFQLKCIGAALGENIDWLAIGH